MKNKSLLIRLFAVVTAMMCALGASAAEAYACYTPSNTTLTFYYDNYRSSRPGTTYDLNTGDNDPGWLVDPEEGTSPVTNVVFDTSFAGARPTTTYSWFYGMENLQSILGMSYLNTSEVTNMGWMFGNCTELTSLDLSHFNTSKVTEMGAMFYCCSSLTSLDLSSFNTSKVTRMPTMFNRCTNLRTVYVGNGWSTAAVTYSANMFSDCTSLVGGQGTTYNASNPKDKTYAHIDGGTSNPGYFTGYEAYACYTPSNTTLTFYYDNQRSSRTGTTYDLNTGNNNPGWFSDNTYSSVTKVVIDPSFKDARPTTTNRWFYGMGSLQSIMFLMNLNTSEVTNMDYMFYSCSSLTNLDLSHFNTTKVTSMVAMFSGSESLTSLDLSSFNTSQVTNMHDMFYRCSGLTSLDLSSIITSKVTNMNLMFGYCTNLTSLDLSSFNTSQVTDMTYMFSNSQSLTSLDLSSFNTYSATNMGGMFWNSSNLRTIYVGNSWGTAAVTNSANMFYNCTSLMGGQGTTYNASNPIDKTYAHIDGGTSNPGYFTAAGTEAYACYTPSNTTLTFYYDTQRSSRPSTTYDLNTGNNYPGWYTDGTIANVTKVVFDSSFAGARPTTTYSWFYNMSNLQTITGINYLNTSEVANMGDMFYGCYQLTRLDLTHFNTSKVTNMGFMFFGCYHLTSLDLTHFNTSKVTDMGYMFYGCSGLTSLDLSSFNTSQVTRMSSMFSRCTDLRTIYVGSGWSIPAVTISEDMFYNCTSLVGGQGTTYNANYIDKTYAHIDGGPSNPGYFTDKNAFLRGDVNGDSHVSIADVTALIDYLLSHDASSINVDAADCNQDTNVSISDVTALIDYLLSGHW
jgi:surface protein